MEKNKIFKKFQSFQKLKISKNSSEKEILERIQKIYLCFVFVNGFES